MAALAAVEELKGSWLDGFVADRRLQGRAKEASIVQYVSGLQWMRRHGLDLEHASLDEIKAWLGKRRVECKLSTYSKQVGIIKLALTYLGRGEEAKKLKKPSVGEDDRAERVKNAVISDEDMAKLIREAPSLRDRLMFELFFELGARRGEIANIRIKDVQFDKHSAVIMLTGKTGTGPRRVFQCVADLRNYLNDHPRKNDPNAQLLMTIAGKRRFSYYSMYDRIRQLAEGILGRPIYPHQFRHTRATKDARYFTDREMMKLNRWKRPDMVGVYAHLSNKDVDDKDLVLHGLKAKEEILRPIMQTQHCPKCREENAPIAIYCVKCGAILASRELEQLANKETVRRMVDEYLATRK